MRSLRNAMRGAAALSIALVALAGCSAEETGNDGAGVGMPSAGASGVGGVGGVSGTSAATGGTSGTGVPIGGTSGAGGSAGDTATAGVSGGAAGTGSLMCGSGEVKEGMCKEKAEGVYAIKLEADVWWQDNGAGLLGLQLVDPGRGKIIVHLIGRLTDVCEDGSGGQGEIKGCGTILPPFRSDANCDSFAITFPDVIWDSPAMPSFLTTGSTTGFNPGDILTLNQATGLLGFSMGDSEGAWPGYMETATVACPLGTGEQCFPDHDGDGKPGITVKMGRIGETDAEAGGCGGFDPPLPFIFRGAPLDGGPLALVDEAPRAETIYIGLRVRMGGAGAIGSDCASGWGESTAKYMNSRVWDCEVADGTNCTDQAANFVDSVAPVYNILDKGAAPPMDVLKPATQGGGPLDQTPSRGALSALVRLGELDQSFSCADVRNAAFPSFGE